MKRISFLLVTIVVVLSANAQDTIRFSLTVGEPFKCVAKYPDYPIIPGNDNYPLRDTQKTSPILTEIKKTGNNEGYFIISNSVTNCNYKYYVNVGYAFYVYEYNRTGYYVFMPPSPDTKLRWVDAYLTVTNIEDNLISFVILPKEEPQQETIDTIPIDKTYTNAIPKDSIPTNLK